MFQKINKFLSALIIMAVSFSANSVQMAASTITPIYAGLANACPTSSVPCFVDYFKKTTQDLCLDSIKVVDPKYWKESRKKQPMPHFALIKKQSNYLPLHQILFMQDSAKDLFTDKKHDAITVAKKLKSGELKLNEIPVIEVWQDKKGRIWTINHRRMVAMILAGIDQVPVKWADEATVLKNSYEFSTTNEGKQITVRLIDNIGMIIKNDGTCNAKILHQYDTTDYDGFNYFISFIKNLIHSYSLN